MHLCACERERERERERETDLPGLCLLAASLGSSSSSEASGGEASAVLSSRCSCWDRYWAGVCLAARAQCSSSLCSKIGRAHV